MTQLSEAQFIPIPADRLTLESNAEAQTGLVQSDLNLWSEVVVPCFLLASSLNVLFIALTLATYAWA